MILRPDDFFDRLYDSLPPSSFQTHKPKELVRAQAVVKEALLKSLCIEDIPLKTTHLDTRVLEEPKDVGGYLRSRVVFKICEGLDCPVYILSPKGNPRFGAVLVCHGHGYGSRDVVGLRPDGSPKAEGEDPGYQKNFAVELVRQGMIVVVPELIGFGDMRLKMHASTPLKDSSCYIMSTRLLMYGLNMAGLRVYQCMRVLDYMQRREDIDPQRMGCMGISGGGLVASFLSALDGRVKAAVVSGYISMFHDSVMSIMHCVDNFPQDILKAGELPDIAALIAPRPLLVEAGTKDSIFPIASVRTALERLSRVYAAFGVTDRLQADIFEGEHQISGALAYDFLRKWLVSP